MIAPTAAASAAPEPDTPPRIMHTMMAAAARPPRRCPTIDDAKRTRLAAIPVRSNTSPARMKSGSASSGYFAMPP